MTAVTLAIAMIAGTPLPLQALQKVLPRFQRRTLHLIATDDIDVENEKPQGSPFIKAPLTSRLAIYMMLELHMESSVISG